MTNSTAATDTHNPSKGDILMAKLTAYGAMAIGGLAAFGATKSAAALVLGYASAGAVLPIVGGAVIVMCVDSLLKDYDAKFGRHKPVAGEPGSPDPAAPAPTAVEIGDSIDALKAEVSELNGKADDIIRAIENRNDGPRLSSGGNAPKL